MALNTDDQSEKVQISTDLREQFSNLTSADLGSITPHLGQSIHQTMAISNALFDHDLISPEAKAAFPDGYIIRPLQRDDYGRGFFECLSVLTYVGNVSEERYLEHFDWMATQGKGIHYFLVIEHEGRIVGTGTLVAERKL